MIDMSNENNPAFSVFDENAPASDFEWVTGLTKLEYFTAHAMQGLLSYRGATGFQGEIATEACNQAQLALRRIEEYKKHMQGESDE